MEEACYARRAPSSTIRAQLARRSPPCRVQRGRARLDAIHRSGHAGAGDLDCTATGLVEAAQAAVAGDIGAAVGGRGAGSRVRDAGPALPALAADAGAAALTLPRFLTRAGGPVGQTAKAAIAGSRPATTRLPIGTGFAELVARWRRLAEPVAAALIPAALAVIATGATVRFAADRAATPRRATGARSFLRLDRGAHEVGCGTGVPDPDEGTAFGRRRTRREELEAGAGRQEGGVLAVANAARAQAALGVAATWLAGGDAAHAHFLGHFAEGLTARLAQATAWRLASFLGRVDAFGARRLAQKRFVVPVAVPLAAYVTVGRRLGLRLRNAKTSDGQEAEQGAATAGCGESARQGIEARAVHGDLRGDEADGPTRTTRQAEAAQPGSPLAPPATLATSSATGIIVSEVVAA